MKRHSAAKFRFFKQFVHFLRLLEGALLVLEGVDLVGLLMPEDLGVSWGK